MEQLPTEKPSGKPEGLTFVKDPAKNYYNKQINNK